MRDWVFLLRCRVLSTEYDGASIRRQGNRASIHIDMAIVCSHSAEHMQSRRIIDSSHFRSRWKSGEKDPLLQIELEYRIRCNDFEGDATP
jgi:hypothetical protein